MGRLRIDDNHYKGLYALGECNFSDHGANRLGASALTGLADGYFVIPYTIANYLADDISTKQFQPIKKSLWKQKRPLQTESIA